MVDELPAAAAAAARSSPAPSAGDALALRVAAITPDARWVTPLRTACVVYDIRSDQRQTMFLAQCAHESAAFTRLGESLHYSAAALLATWPSRFTASEATAFAYDDQRIAERVYGGRMGNGPEGSGDGWRYRGRGLIQITGRANYAACGRALEIDLEAFPELLVTRTLAALSAGWFWAMEAGANELADAGDFLAITRRISGGSTGTSDRVAWLERLEAVA